MMARVFTPRMALLCLLTAGLLSANLLGGCGEDETRAPLTRLQRLQRAQAARPPLPEPAQTPEKAAKPPEKPGESILIGACPLAGEDPSTCPPHQPSKLPPPATHVTVAHVLIGWHGTLPNTAGPNPAARRDRDTARSLARRIAHETRLLGADFMQLAQTRSDDRGTGVFTVDADTAHRYVPEFVEAAKKLGPGHIDAFASRLGYHVVKRMPDGFVAPEPHLIPVVNAPCPLPGEDILACPAKPAVEPARVVVEHILFGYKGSQIGHRQGRSRADARKIAIATTHDARQKGARWQAMKKRLSDDPGDGRYEVGGVQKLQPAFEQLARSLSVGNVDAVATPFGFHVIKRLR